MKYRSGFVSNSSTSSFVITTTEDNYLLTLSLLHPYVRAVVEAVGPEYGGLLGKKVVTLGVSEGNVDTFEYLDISFDGEIPKEIIDKEDYYGSAASAAWNMFIKKLGTTNVITTTVECG